MSEHRLKVAPAYWDALTDGSKVFEVRRNDRGFQRGDTLVLHVLGKDGCTQAPCRPCGTPEPIRRVVTYVFAGDPSLRDVGGIVPGYVVLGLGATDE